MIQIIDLFDIVGAGAGLLQRWGCLQTGWGSACPHAERVPPRLHMLETHAGSVRVLRRSCSMPSPPALEPDEHQARRHLPQGAGHPHLHLQPSRSSRPASLSVHECPPPHGGDPVQGNAPGDMHAAFRSLNLQRGPSLDDSSSSSDEDEATFGRQAASRPSLKVHSGFRN